MRIQSLWAPLSAFYFCHRRGDLCAPLCTRWDRLHTYKFCERRAEEEDMSSFLPVFRPPPPHWPQLTAPPLALLPAYAEFGAALANTELIGTSAVTPPHLVGAPLETCCTSCESCAAMDSDRTRRFWPCTSCAMPYEPRATS